jgi:hypothetical protein
VPAVDIDDLDDFHLAAQGNTLAIVLLDETSRGIKRIRVSRLSGGTWQMSDTLLYSKAATPRDIPVTSIGPTVYVAFAKPQGVISSSYSPPSGRSPSPGLPPNSAPSTMSPGSEMVSSPRADRITWPTPGCSRTVRSMSAPTT